MTGLLIALGVLIVYLAIGYVLGRWQLPQAWARVKAENAWWSHSMQQDYVLRFLRLCVVLWPVMIPKTLINTFFDHSVVAADPEYIKARQREQALTIKQQQDHIRQLEIELGIGPGDRG